MKPYVRKEAADIRREEKAREKEKAKERKREMKGEGGKASKSKRSTLPAGVTVTAAVTDVCKHKGKKKNYVQLTVEVSVLNNSSESLKVLHTHTDEPLQPTFHFVSATHLLSHTESRSGGDDRLPQG